MIPRPKTFGGKLFALFVLVVAATEIATLTIVSRAHLAQARKSIDTQLTQAERAFVRVVAERNALLVAGAASAARDFPIKQLFVAEDGPTLASALVSVRLTSGGDIVCGLKLDGTLLASTAQLAAGSEIFAQLVARADADPSPNATATGYGYLDGQLYSLVIVPVRAPDIIAWLVIGFRIDGDFAARLKEQTGVDLTFFNHDGRPLASTLPPLKASTLMDALPRLRGADGNMEEALEGETVLVRARRYPAGEGRIATLALQYSLDERLRDARESERIVVYVGAGCLLLAGLLSRVFARRLTRPIVELVGHTRRITAGDYSIRNTSYRLDELGRLAEAFDQMARGLAERDRVRDLLDKNVSPEVAAQLMRDGAALGGEEREATILFADLRGFTPLSEKLPPRELVQLLNRYLDRMSAEIERHGGVIDKFIGDAIMALFGAPVSQADAADRALAAALGMERALVALNAELAAEGRPPLALGIGVNTAKIVAGNIGSHRRLNYSVIGDGVNVAARLQSLTRTPEYATNIVTSAATLAALREPARIAARPLGRVQVKGRSEAVEIFAVGS